jgi:hypothetical protein
MRREKQKRPKISFHKLTLHRSVRSDANARRQSCGTRSQTLTRIGLLLVRLIKGRIHAYGIEAVCKYCGDVLEIREDKIFCGGRCGTYQGEFSRDLDDFLRWEGVKSYTIRKKVAEVEGLNLEPRDLEPIPYAPNWSVLEEYEEFPDYDEPEYSTYDSTK